MQPLFIFPPPLCSTEVYTRGVAINVANHKIRLNLGLTSASSWGKWMQYIQHVYCLSIEYMLCSRKGESKGLVRAGGAQHGMELIAWPCWALVNPTRGVNKWEGEGGLQGWEIYWAPEAPPQSSEVNEVTATINDLYYGRSACFSYGEDGICYKLCHLTAVKYSSEQIWPLYKQSLGVWRWSRINTSA